MMVEGRKPVARHHKRAPGGDYGERLRLAARVLAAKPFEPHPLLRNGHAQTLAGLAWPRGFRPSSHPEDEARLFEIERGVRLLARCRWHENRTERPTLVLVHGLGGSSESPYVLGVDRLAYRAGMNVVRLNQRNCGGTERLTPTLYHSGMSGDLRAVVGELVEDDRLRRVFVGGFSMGGNLVLKMAGELAEKAPCALLGVCVVSPLLDLAETARRIEWPSNRPYQWSFVRGLRRLVRRKSEVYPDLYDARGLDRVRTIREYDNLYIAPHGGFADADDYYARSSALRFVPGIRLPTLVIHAQDDPLVPIGPLRRPEVLENAWVLTATPPHGGHVAFISDAKTGGRFWAEERLVEFFGVLSCDS
jgi:predicted alpha/beta-fold hydrolase